MITPEQFSASAIAWIGAITVVGTAAAVALAKVAPMANQIKMLFKLHESNTTAIQENTNKIVDVALSVPPQQNITQNLDTPHD